MQFFTALLSVLTLAVSTTATPVHVAERSELIVVAPHVMQPSGGETYDIGSTQTCYWETDSIPPIAVNRTGTLVLGHYKPGDSSENLDYKNPVATDFLLTAGSTTWVVPRVVPGGSYFLALVGDSGDLSALFSILALPDPNSS